MKLRMDRQEAEEVRACSKYVYITEYYYVGHYQTWTECCASILIRMTDKIRYLDLLDGP